MYRIFNHFIDSNIPLPELCRVEEEEIGQGVKVLGFHLREKTHDLKGYDWIHHWCFSDGSITISLAREGENYLLRFPGLADFLIQSEDHHITCFPQTGTIEETVRHLLLDQVIPRIMAHSGNIVLHASAVMIDGQAVVFVGDTGWGKSTLAASFYVSGDTLISDDCLMFNFKDGHLAGISNYAGIRLLPDSILKVFRNNQIVQDMAHYSDKKRLTVRGQTVSFVSGIPIVAIFVLDFPEINEGKCGIEIETIEGANRLIELIKHSFMLDLTDKKRVADKMQDLGNVLSNHLPMYWIRYPHDHAILDNVRHQIIEIIAEQDYQKVSAL